MHFAGTHYNARLRITSSAPTRIDLAGGTLDIWPLYLFHKNAQTLNVAITRRAECVLSPHPNSRLRLVATDIGSSIEVSSAAELENCDANPLLSRIARHFSANSLVVSTRSDSPVGAGLAGSSALNVALCAAFRRWNHQSIEPEPLMQLAGDLEAQVINVPTGAQDYRPATYGGIATLLLRPGLIERLPLPIDHDDLTARVLLAYTGQTRQSGINNWLITKAHIDGDKAIFALFEEIRDIALSMRNALEHRHWNEVGRNTAAEWELRKRLAPSVTNAHVDQIIQTGIDAGAMAGKLCGAGGGGCAIFIVEPDTRLAVQRAIELSGAKILDYAVDTEGLIVETDEDHGTDGCTPPITDAI